MHDQNSCVAHTELAASQAFHRLEEDGSLLQSDATSNHNSQRSNHERTVSSGSQKQALLAEVRGTSSGWEGMSALISRLHNPTGVQDTMSHSGSFGMMHSCAEQMLSSGVPRDRQQQWDGMVLCQDSGREWWTRHYGSTKP